MPLPFSPCCDDDQPIDEKPKATLAVLYQAHQVNVIIDIERETRTLQEIVTYAVDLIKSGIVTSG